MNRPSQTRNHTLADGFLESFEALEEGLPVDQKTASARQTEANCCFNGATGSPVDQTCNQFVPLASTAWLQWCHGIARGSNQEKAMSLAEAIQASMVPRDRPWIKLYASVDDSPDQRRFNGATGSPVDQTGCATFVQRGQFQGFNGATGSPVDQTTC